MRAPQSTARPGTRSAKLGTRAPFIELHEAAFRELVLDLADPLRPAHDRAPGHRARAIRAHLEAQGWSNTP